MAQNIPPGNHESGGWLDHLDEITTFTVAIIIVIGCLYGLLREGTPTDARVIYGGLLGAISTYFFTKSTTKAANISTINAQNNGLGEIRKTVDRIEGKQNGGHI